jgi:predicted dehydrogenase
VHDPPGLSCEAAARHYEAPLAFSDCEKLARHPDVDLVTVSVKVPDHHRPVMAATEAGKHVYFEWPLGRDTAEAVRMRDAANARGIRHAVGLQGQMSPPINYLKDLVAEGYVGRVLSATMIACAPNWGATIDRAYQADRANGANLLTITSGHTADALCHCLGEFRELAAFAVSQRDRTPLAGTGEVVAKTVPDQVAVSGIAGNGCRRTVSGAGRQARGTHFLHGEEGDLVPMPTTRNSMQRQTLALKGARGDDALVELPVPGKYGRVPEEVPLEDPYNVPQPYTKLGESGATILLA